MVYKLTSSCNPLKVIARSSWSMYLATLHLVVPSVCPVKTCHTRNWQSELSEEGLSNECAVHPKSINRPLSKIASHNLVSVDPQPRTALLFEPNHWLHFAKIFTHSENLSRNFGTPSAVVGTDRRRSFQFVTFRRCNGNPRWLPKRRARYWAGWSPGVLDDVYGHYAPLRERSVPYGNEVACVFHIGHLSEGKQNVLCRPNP